MSDTPPPPSNTAATGMKPLCGIGLQALRITSGLDEESFADALGLDREAYHRMERGEAVFPTALLPPLARLLDAPLTAIVADLHGAGEYTAELRSLTAAYVNIPTPWHREALLAMALALSRD